MTWGLGNQISILLCISQEPKIMESNEQLVNKIAVAEAVIETDLTEVELETDLMEVGFRSGVKRGHVCWGCCVEQYSSWTQSRSL